MREWRGRRRRTCCGWDRGGSAEGEADGNGELAVVANGLETAFDAEGGFVAEPVVGAGAEVGGAAIAAAGGDAEAEGDEGVPAVGAALAVEVIAGLEGEEAEAGAGGEGLVADFAAEGDSFPDQALGAAAGAEDAIAVLAGAGEGGEIEVAVVGGALGGEGERRQEEQEQRASHGLMMGRAGEEGKGSAGKEVRCMGLHSATTKAEEDACDEAFVRRAFSLGAGSLGEACAEPGSPLLHSDGAPNEQPCCEGVRRE